MLSATAGRKGRSRVAPKPHEGKVERDFQTLAHLGRVSRAELVHTPSRHPAPHQRSFRGGRPGHGRKLQRVEALVQSLEDLQALLWRGRLEVLVQGHQHGGTKDLAWPGRVVERWEGHRGVEGTVLSKVGSIKVRPELLGLRRDAVGWMQGGAGQELSFLSIHLSTTLFPPRWSAFLACRKW